MPGKAPAVTRPVEGTEVFLGVTLMPAPYLKAVGLPATRDDQGGNQGAHEPEIIRRSEGNTSRRAERNAHLAGRAVGGLRTSGELVKATSTIGQTVAAGRFGAVSRRIQPSTRWTATGAPLSPDQTSDNIERDHR
jgi:hypothetical protein